MPDNEPKNEIGVQKLLVWRSMIEPALEFLKGREFDRFAGAMMLYVFTGEEPVFTGKKAQVMGAIWISVKRQIDTAVRNQSAGKASAAARKTDASGVSDGVANGVQSGVLCIHV